MPATSSIRQLKQPIMQPVAGGQPVIRPVEAAPFHIDNQSIPDPSEKFVRALATHAFEAVEGVRSIAQLGTAITLNVARQLAQQRDLLRERNSLSHDTRRCIPYPGRMHLCRTLPRLAEATVVVHTARRAHAVALCLEWVHGRWRACELHVL